MWHPCAEGRSPYPLIDSVIATRLEMPFELLDIPEKGKENDRRCDCSSIYCTANWQKNAHASMTGSVKSLLSDWSSCSTFYSVWAAPFPTGDHQIKCPHFHTFIWKQRDSAIDTNVIIDTNKNIHMRHEAFMSSCMPCAPSCHFYCKFRAVSLFPCMGKLQNVRPLWICHSHISWSKEMNVALKP